MIVREHDGGLLLVSQEDHARLSGELAAALARPPALAGALVAAARVHDNGWRETDAEAPFDAGAGRPHSYRDVPSPLYRDLWRRGIRRAADADPLTGLLVMLHGARFMRASGDPATRAMASDELAREGDALLAELGMPGSFGRPPPEVEEASEWLRLLDLASLYACHGATDEWAGTVGSVRFGFTRAPDGAVRMTPWALARPLRHVLPALALPRARYASERAFRDDLRQARPTTLAVAFEPG